MGFKPSHRDQEQPQPEVCQLTGRLVPAADLVISEAEGMEGAAICSISPFAARVRRQLSYDQMRGLDPVPRYEDELDTSGDSSWWEETE